MEFMLGWAMVHDQYVRNRRKGEPRPPGWPPPTGPSLFTALAGRALQRWRKAPSAKQAAAPLSLSQEPHCR